MYSSDRINNYQLVAVSSLISTPLNVEFTDSEFLSYNLMLNSGKKNCALRDKKKNSNVVRKKISERSKKP
jgi:hypothetical protein